MTRTTLFGAAGLALALTAASGVAQAQGRGTYFDPLSEAPPVVIHKRLPFTDSSNSVPVGYEHEYIVDQTTALEPVYGSFRPDAFGNDVLPGRFGEIGRGY